MLRDMAAYPGECYPVEVDLEVLNGNGDVVGCGRLMACGCTDNLILPWPHR